MGAPGLWSVTHVRKSQEVLEPGMLSRELILRGHGSASGWTIQPVGRDGTHVSGCALLGEHMMRYALMGDPCVIQGSLCMNRGVVDTRGCLERLRLSACGGNNALSLGYRILNNALCCAMRRLYRKHAGSRNWREGWRHHQRRGLEA